MHMHIYIYIYIYLYLVIATVQAEFGKKLLLVEWIISSFIKYINFNLIKANAMWLTRNNN